MYKAHIVRQTQFVHELLKHVNKLEERNSETERLLIAALEKNRSI